MEKTKQELWAERIQKPEDQTQRKALESLIQLLNEAITYLPLGRAVLE